MLTLRKREKMAKLTLFLETVTAGEFCAEFFNTSSGVNIFESSGIKRMTSVTNIDLHIRFRAFGDKRIAATASHFCFNVFGVDFLFHDRYL